ncbi:hypothetical protein [Microbacterium esteraromaticum]|uniref:hypothetical protein n=1 Tax=Microbacterium esteraromaticum TaxID=57043 RepID=UPI0019D3BC78|nr:hypothetical protein [Microbacterium esteraromaticum]MBN7794888.1 hypothetical protein [Microbacterium esteraromaticum]
MLHPIDPRQSPPPTAYCAPWVVTRDDRAHPVVMNAGQEPVDFVRVFRDDVDARCVVDLWGQVLPTETVELCLCASAPDEAVVTIAWFRQADGLEYVWRFVV